MLITDDILMLVKKFADHDERALQDLLDVVTLAYRQGVVDATLDYYEDMGEGDVEGLADLFPEDIETIHEDTEIFYSELVAFVSTLPRADISAIVESVGRHNRVSGALDDLRRDFPGLFD